MRMQPAARITCAFVAFAAMSSAGFFAWHTLQIRHHARVHAISSSQQDLRDISTGLIALYEVDGVRVPHIGADQFQMTGSELYAQLASSPTALTLARPSDLSTRRAAFHDRWGSPIGAVFSRRVGALHVTIRSNGPNGIDEAGRGDDIVFEFDLKPPVQNSVGQ